MSDAVNLRIDPRTGEKNYTDPFSEELTVAELEELPGVFGVLLTQVPHPTSIEVYRSLDPSVALDRITTTGEPALGQFWSDSQQLKPRGYVIVNSDYDGEDLTIVYAGGGYLAHKRVLEEVIPVGPEGPAGPSMPDAINAASDKTSPADGDRIGFTDSAASYVLKRFTFANLWTWISVKVNALTSKTTPVDNDELYIIDSAASNVPKKVLFSNLFVWVVAKVFALTGKTTPADADQFLITDSAASNVGKSLTWANIKVALAAIFAPAQTVLWVRDEKSSGTAAAALTATTWNKRELGTTSLNTISGASIASSVISLPSGTYEAAAFATIANLTTDSIGHQIRLFNTSDSSLIAKGSSAWIATGTTSGVPSLIMNSRFTIAATKNIELQHWVGAANPGGRAVSSGTVEVYAEVFIKKVG